MRAGDDFLRGLAFLTLSMFLFAVMDALSRILVVTYPVPMILWIRFAFFLAFGALVVGPAGLRAALRTRIPWLQTGRSVALIFEIGIFILAFRYLPIADVHAVAASTPLIVLLVAAPLLGEHVRLRVWIAVGVGFLGVLLIVRPGLREFEWFHLIPIVGAISWGFYQVLVRLVGRSDPAGTTLLWSGLVGFAATSFVGPLFWVAPDLAGSVLLIVSGALGALAHWTLIKAYEACSVARLQPYNYTLVLWALIVGLILLGEFPDAATVAGAAIVSAAGLYTWLSEVRDQRSEVRRNRSP